MSCTASDQNLSTPAMPEDLKRMGLLKFAILAYGLCVSEIAKQQIVSAKGPIRTRSGSSGGLDIVLPYDIHVNAPVNEGFAASSPFTLDVAAGDLVVKRGDEILTKVKLQATPLYYQLSSSTGVPLVQVGQMCSGDRFCYGMTGPYCWFWKPDRRCKYCSIGLNKNSDATQKTTEQLLEALQYAVDDPEIPAKHILIGGGTPEGKDMGAILASQLCEAVKRRFSLNCYVMISAPLENKYIDMLRDAGADELGMNLEFYSDKAWAEWIPGKNRHIGKKRYLEALEYAVSVFGPINTRSILIVGLESPQHSIDGVKALASIGVMPILSPFRPLTGSELEHRSGFDHLTYWDIYTESLSRAAQYAIPLGPTCVPCQNNTLALPLPNGQYRFY